MISTGSRFRTAILCALLFGGTLLLFSRATRFGFLNYDDPTYVTANPHVQGGLGWPGVVWAFTAPMDYWHPLTWLGHMLDWQLFGADASGHHFVSELWHALNAVLVFLLFRRLNGGFWLSAFAAALFAWHPLRVESVVWVTERKDVMSGCFFLLTLLAYTRYLANRAAGRPPARAYLLTLGAFAAGLMSKPMLVTVPAILLILDFWPFARLRTESPGRLLREKLPFFALSLVTGIVTVLMQRQSGAFVIDVPLGARLGNAVVSFARYLGKFAWPFDLIVCYPHPGYWPVAAVAAAAVLALALGGLAWRERRSRPWIAAGLAWFAITLLPVIGLIQVGFQAMADRYTYLPLLGVEIALLWSLPVPASRAARTTAAVAGAVILAGCGWRTWDQEGVWRDSVSLFEHAVAVSARNDAAEDLLGSALYAVGRIDEAAAHAERARELNPRNPSPLVTLASVDQRRGRLDEAVTLYRAALALRPNKPELQCELGLLELATGHPDEARRLMVPALKADPAYLERTRQIARHAVQAGQAGTARGLFEIMLAAAPDDADAHAGLGYILLLTGDRAGGIAHWRRALKIDPAIPGLREQLRQIETR